MRFYGVLDHRKKTKTRFSCVILGLKAGKTRCYVRCQGLLILTMKNRSIKTIFLKKLGRYSPSSSTSNDFVKILFI